VKRFFDDKFAVHSKIDDNGEKISFGWVWSNSKDGDAICVPITEKFIRKYRDELTESDWEYISNTESPLSDEFLTEFADKLSWGRISLHQRLTDNLIRKYVDRLDICQCAASQDLSEDTIERLGQREGWTFWALVARNQKMSREFMEKHLACDVFTLNDLLSRVKRDFDEEFLREHIDEVKWNIGIVAVQELSNEFVVELQMKGYL